MVDLFAKCKRVDINEQGRRYRRSEKKKLYRIRQTTGDTALHLATREGHASVVRQLLQHRADASVTNVKRQTPLDIANKALALMEFT